MAGQNIMVSKKSSTASQIAQASSACSVLAALPKLRWLARPALGGEARLDRTRRPKHGGHRRGRCKSRLVPARVEVHRGVAGSAATFRRNRGSLAPVISADWCGRRWCSARADVPGYPVHAKGFASSCQFRPGSAYDAWRSAEQQMPRSNSTGSDSDRHAAPMTSASVGGDCSRGGDINSQCQRWWSIPRARAASPWTRPWK